MSVKKDFGNVEEAWIARAQYLPTSSPKKDDVGFLDTSSILNDGDECVGANSIDNINESSIEQTRKHK